MHHTKLQTLALIIVGKEGLFDGDVLLDAKARELALQGPDGGLLR
jgi:hypothetical protein